MIPGINIENQSKNMDLRILAKVCYTLILMILNKNLRHQDNKTILIQIFNFDVSGKFTIILSK